MWGPITEKKPGRKEERKGGGKEGVGEAKMEETKPELGMMAHPVIPVLRT